MRNVLEDKISVVVTAYNVEKYLKECLDSVVSQSYTNLEIIIVNAQSSDKTEDIIKDFTQRYENISYFNVENKGPAHSRNEGIKKATGKYITFVDGDDIISKNMYLEMLSVLKSEDADVVYCTCFRFFDDDINKTSMRNIKPVVCSGCEDIGQNMILPIIANFEKGLEVSASMCMSLYKKEIIDKYNIFAKDMSEVFSEDNFFNIEYLSKCQKAAAINKPYYYYRKHSQSISNQVHDYTVSALKNFEEYTLKIGAEMGLSSDEIKLRNKIKFIVLFSAVVKKKIDALSYGEYKKYIRNLIKENNLSFDYTRYELSLTENQVKLFWILMRYKMYFPLYILVKIYSKLISR